MNNTSTAYVGARLFDGDRWYEDHALLAKDGKVAGIVPMADLPGDVDTRDVSGHRLVPGFIDLQVNGGGGALLNLQPDLEGIRQICAAHARFGTTALLATLITDTVEVRDRAIEAGKQAADAEIPGFLGLHLEGPHLSIARKGVHDPALIRPMDDLDLRAILDCVEAVPALLVTVAPENVSFSQVTALASAGIVVSLGHTDTDYATVAAYVAAGASMVTHLFNAMSPLSHREPGVVGAALSLGSLDAGLIADGFHVDPAAIGIALRAKTGPGRIFLVTDAMSTIGSDQTGFLLNGRQIYRHGGRLTTADGTLAGADIDMLSSIRFLHEAVGLDLDEALRMASAYPADAMRMADTKGRLKTGMDADFVLLNDDLALVETVIGGKTVFAI